MGSQSACIAALLLSALIVEVELSCGPPQPKIAFVESSLSSLAALYRLRIFSVSLA